MTISDPSIPDWRRVSTISRGLMPSSSLPVEAFEAEDVRGYSHKAAGGVGDGMVLTHGTGGSWETPLLVAIRKPFKRWRDRLALRSSLSSEKIYRTAWARGCSQRPRRPPVRGCCAQGNR